MPWSPTSTPGGSTSRVRAPWPGGVSRRSGSDRGTTPSGTRVPPSPDWPCPPPPPPESPEPESVGGLVLPPLPAGEAAGGGDGVFLTHLHTHFPSAQLCWQSCASLHWPLVHAVSESAGGYSA